VVSVLQLVRGHESTLRGLLSLVFLQLGVLLIDKMMIEFEIDELPHPESATFCFLMPRYQELGDVVIKDP
jgi:hypothetical protein